MTVVPLVFLGALVFALINWLKFIKGQDWNSAITQAIVWVAGFIVAWLAAQSRSFGNWAPTGTPLRLLGTADLFFLGITLGSTPTAGNELLKALDRNNSTVTPHLFPRLSRHAAPPPPTRPLRKKAA